MRLAPTLALLAVATLAGTACAQAPATHQHQFGDAARWTPIFDDPRRDAWQKPHEVIQTLALKPDAVVADIGAGTGYFTVRLARMLPKAKVYAADIEADMVKHLGERARREKLANVRVVQSSLDDARLPEPV
ncbi:MAG TPA: class I SAM-dependent methyltransferase, partial [Burkholderiales bacterium]|nr:class I SAM-dependent methyltransferase [Burkholderiales bacterium]